MTTVERIAALEQNDKTIFHQLDELKEDVNNIHKLTTAVEVIAVRTTSIDKKVDGIDKRMDAVEKAPVDDYKHYKRLIIGCIVTGVLSALIVAAMAVILK